MPTYLHDVASVAMGGLSLPPHAAYTGAGTDTGSAVDMITGDQQCFALLEWGAVATDATDTLAVKIQESTASAGTYTDVVGGAFTGINGASTANGFQFISFLRTKEFLRALGTRVSGNSASFLYTVFIGEQLKTF